MEIPYVFVRKKYGQEIEVAMEKASSRALAPFFMVFANARQFDCSPLTKILSFPHCLDTRSLLFFSHSSHLACLDDPAEIQIA